MHTEYVTRPVRLTGGRPIGLIPFNLLLPFIGLSFMYNTQKCIETGDDEAAFCRFQSGTEHLSHAKYNVSCIMRGSLTQKINRIQISSSDLSSTDCQTVLLLQQLQPCSSYAT